MDVEKVFEAIARIIAAREGVKIEVKSIQKIDRTAEKHAAAAKGD